MRLKTRSRTAPRTSFNKRNRNPDVDQRSTPRADTRARSEMGSATDSTNLRRHPPHKVLGCAPSSVNGGRGRVSVAPVGTMTVCRIEDLPTSGLVMLPNKSGVFMGPLADDRLSEESESGVRGSQESVLRICDTAHFASGYLRLEFDRLLRRKACCRTAPLLCALLPGFVFRVATTFLVLVSIISPVDGSCSRG